MSADAKLKQLPNCLGLFACLLVVFTLTSGKVISAESLLHEASLQNANNTLSSQGKQIFDTQCAACHAFNVDSIGPKLGYLPPEANTTWLTSFIRAPRGFANSGNERAIEVSNTYPAIMPAFTLSDTQMLALLSYIDSQQLSPQTNAEINANANNAKTIMDPISSGTSPANFDINIEFITTVKSSAKTAPRAKINKLEGVVLDGKQRLFVNDIRGSFFEIIASDYKQNKPTVVELLDIANTHEDFINSPGFAMGFSSFAFSPNFAKDGYLYTAHSEKKTNLKKDFALPVEHPGKYEWVVSRWTFDEAKTRIDKESYKELMRLDMFESPHAVQMLSFRPNISAQHEDYGLLYIGVGDGGASYHRLPELFDTHDLIWGKLLRIDPRGSNSKNGQYGIPSTNPYVSHNTFLPEIYASGFRNPNVFSWLKNGHLIVADIGHWNIEELNVVNTGQDYGWPLYEGTFEFPMFTDQRYVSQRSEYNPKYIDPALQLDHDEMLAIMGGYQYQGQDIPFLKKWYLFGDIVGGNIFGIKADELASGKHYAVTNKIRAIGLKQDNQDVSISQLVNNERADLRISQDALGDIYLMSKSTGQIWKITGISKRR